MYLYNKANKLIDSDDISVLIARDICKKITLRYKNIEKEVYLDLSYIINRHNITNPLIKIIYADKYGYASERYIECESEQEIDDMMIVLECIHYNRYRPKMDVMSRERFIDIFSIFKKYDLNTDVFVNSVIGGDSREYNITDDILTEVLNGKYDDIQSLHPEFWYDQYKLDESSDIYNGMYTSCKLTYIFLQDIDDNIKIEKMKDTISNRSPKYVESISDILYEISSCKLEKSSKLIDFVKLHNIL